MTEDIERDVQGDGGTPEPNANDELAKLRAELKRVNHESAARRKELEAKQAALDAAENAKLADQQKWQELAEKLQRERDDLKPYREQIESVNETLTALLKAQLDELPDEARAMVDDLPGNTQQKIDWLAKNRTKLLKPLAPAMDAGSRGDSTPYANVKLTAEEEEAIRMAQRVDPTMTRERVIARKIQLGG